MALDVCKVLCRHFYRMKLFRVQEAVSPRPLWNHTTGAWERAWVGLMGAHTWHSSGMPSCMRLSPLSIPRSLMAVNTAASS